ncbi:MAG: MIP family channel protein [Oscillospiraceae bacterium]|nr:MIP family channel protein [Oscillospiraceae bacterium]MDD4368362.1 MIP family channel protein [Oscillospiraceae bacterium]
MKKYIAEFFGTFVLVFFGCGTAVVTGGFTGGTGSGFLGVAAIALAFGLSIVAAAYAIGPISGCHVNPAVSLGVLVSGKMSFKDFIGYVVGQVAGAFAASAVFSIVLANSTLEGYGADGYGELSGVGLGLGGALVVEFVLTFVFVMTVLGVTSSEQTANLAGLMIGLTLTLVHLIGIPLTGTSVNPARSLAPAVFTGGTALQQVWVFILAPFAGGALAGVVHRYFYSKKALA